MQNRTHVDFGGKYLKSLPSFYILSHIFVGRTTDHLSPCSVCMKTLCTHYKSAPLLALHLGMQVLSEIDFEEMMLQSAV